MLTFSINKTSEEVLGAMVGIDLRVNTEVGRQWLGELFINAVEGRVSEDTDVSAYGYVCEQNTKMAKGKREVSLITVDEAVDGVKGVADVVASYVDENIDQLIESSEFKYHVEQFVEMREYLLVEEGIDLWVILKLARKMNESAIKTIRRVVETYEKLGDVIKTILSNQDCFTVLGGRINALYNQQVSTT